jgi:Xaa-Pro dipeptidase
VENKLLIFKVEEFKNRIDRVRSRMEKKKIDFMLINTPENIFYLTGHHSPGYYMYMSLLLPIEGDVELILRQGELGNARTYSWLSEDQLIVYDDTDDPTELTVKTIRKINKGNIGIELDSWFLKTCDYLKVTGMLSEFKIIDASGLVEQERIIKSSQEIEYIREAALIASEAMEKAVERVKAGANDNEIAAEIFYSLCKSGSEYLGLEPFVASGPRSGTMHSSWAGRKIYTGDSVLLEIAGCKNRYHGALMRTVHVGNPPEKVKHWSEVCIKALNAAIKEIKPGVTSGQVDEACRGIIEREGLYEKFRKRTGYSIGIAFAPDWGEGQIMSLQKDDSRILHTGMVFHMPPALREYGKFGVGFSETVLVVDDGCEVLTKFKRELIVSS